MKTLLKKPERLFLLLALWSSLEYWFGGPFSYLEVHDVGDCVLPRGMLMARQWWEHGLTYWLPALAGGADRLANGGSYASPSGLLLLVLPGWLGFAALQFVWSLLSGYFTFRLCRDDLKLDVLACLYAGAAVSSVHGADALAHQWGYAALPFMLWAVPRVGGRSWVWTAALGLGYGLCSSAATSLPFCLAAIAAWFLLVDRRASPAFWLKFAVVSAVAIVPHAHSLWAMSLNAPLSHRASWAKPAPSWDVLAAYLRTAWSNLLSFKVSLALAAAGFVAGRKEAARARPLLGLLLAATVGTAVLNFVLLFFADRLGFLNGFQFARFALLAPLFAACAGAAGLGALSEGTRTRMWLVGVAFAALIAASATEKYAAASSWLLEGSIAANLGGSALGRLPAASEPYRVATIPHGLHPAYAHAEGLETADGYSNLYPKTYQRFWERVVAPAGAVRGMSSMTALLHEWGNRLYLILDEAPRYPERLPFDAYYRGNLLSLANTRYVLSLCPLEGRDLVAVTVPPAPVEGKRAKVLQRLRENLFGRGRAYVYENKAVLPRAFVARRISAIADEAAFWTALSAAPAAALRETVFVRGEAPAGARPAVGRLDARISVYSPDRVEVSLDGDGGGFLVVTNNLSPFWKARVDGAPREIFPAYATFWGVAVAKGDKRVVFTYEPPYRLNRP